MKMNVSYTEAQMANARKRFLSYTFEGNEKGCKLFGGLADEYGQFRIGYGIIGAHRAAYLIFVGSIPDGKHVCHTCDVKNCVNTDHLFIGTHQDNMLDMHKKGRWRTGIFGDHLKLNQQMADNIYRDTRTQQAIADDYGISRSLVSNIKNGRVWGKNRQIPKEHSARIAEMTKRLNS